MNTRLALVVIATSFTLMMGCAATHTAIAKRHLNVQTQMSHAIFLSPPSTDEPLVYVNVRNTTGDPALDVAQSVESALAARGFRLTRNAAQALKMEKEIGTIEAGKLADIIAVNGDPLENIRCIQDKKNIQLVMKEGKVYADRRPGHDKNVVNVKAGDWKIIDYL